MKIFFLVVSILIPTFLFSQNESKIKARVKETYRINKIKSQKITEIFQGRSVIDSVNFDDNGNVISDKFVYDSLGQLIKEYYCDSCRIWFWSSKYENGKKISCFGFGHDSLLVSSTINKYDAQGRLSKYYSYTKDMQVYNALVSIERIDSQDSTYYIKDTLFTDKFDTVTVQYSGDTIKYFHKQKPEPSVYLERYNKKGFLIEYIEFQHKNIWFRITYKYDNRGNLISKISFNSEGNPYLKDLYYYDERNLVYKMEHYQNDLTKPNLIYLYEYRTK